jgi:uncharacterized membrane-anchored protein
MDRFACARDDDKATHERRLALIGVCARRASTARAPHRPDIAMRVSAPFVLLAMWLLARRIRANHSEH